MDTLILGIVGSIIATAIICIARKLFQWFPKPSISNIQLNKVILISSIFISTLVFVFGNILEPAVLWLFEPDKINYNFGKIYLKQFPQYFFLSVFSKPTSWHNNWVLLHYWTLTKSAYLVRFNICYNFIIYF